MAAKLTVAKFGGSAIGPDGILIPRIIERIGDLRKDGSKVIAVFSAPLTVQDGRRRSLTDIVLEQGRNAEGGRPQAGGNKDGSNTTTATTTTTTATAPSLQAARATYQKIIDMGTSNGSAHRKACQEAVEYHLGESQKALDAVFEGGRFADELRSRALAFSGEILMSHVMNHIMRAKGMRSNAVDLKDWPIITDNNIESTNFLASRSADSMQAMRELVRDSDIVSMGGFIGKTTDNVLTTYERGGSDRTAADLGILFHREYDTRIDFEKDSSVVSADPKTVESGLRSLSQLSYNEARLAGMFGMKILDPIAIKEIVENGIDIPITVTNMKNPSMTTTIKRIPNKHQGHPIKIVTGKENCAIFRMETDLLPRLLASLEKDRRYSEFVMLSPFVRDGTEFSRVLFMDGDYVRRNEKYLLGFDSLATITYDRGVITLIGDEMWRVQHVVSRTSAKIGEANINILNMDAQEETSRIIIIIDDARDGIRKAIRVIHPEISEINFV